MTLLKVLKILHEEGPSLHISGICGNIAELVHEMDVVPAFDEDDLHEIMAQWPKYSGDSIYPIPCPSGKSPKAAYLGAGEGEMWNPSHPYGALRLELLDWCIAELEKAAE